MVVGAVSADAMAIWGVLITFKLAKGACGGVVVSLLNSKEELLVLYHTLDATDGVVGKT